MRKIYSIPFIIYLGFIFWGILSIIIIICSIVHQNPEYLFFILYLLFLMLIFYFLCKSIKLYFYDDKKEFVYYKFFMKKVYNINDIYMIKLEGYSINYGLAYVYIYPRYSRVIRFDCSKKLIKELINQFSDVEIKCDENIKKELKRLRVG